MIYCPVLLASQDLFICLRPLEQFLSLVCLADEMDGDHLSCRSERFHIVVADKSQSLQEVHAAQLS